MTKSQSRSINRAYDTLSAHIDSTNMSIPYALRQALKAEKRECSGLIWAKSLIVKAFVEGYDNPRQAAQELIGIRDGYLRALLIGVECALHHKTGPEKMAILRAGVAAHQAAIKERLDS